MNDALKYCKHVVNGKITACRWVKLACRRHLDDLKHGKKRGIYYDQASADHVISFIEDYCRHVKGRWAKKYDENRQERDTRIKLEPWQKFITSAIFGWKKKKDDSRRFRTAYIEVARKNAKTTWAAGIALYLFIADDEPGAEVYSTATTRDQAKIVHDIAVRMRERDGDLENHIDYYKASFTMVVDETASKFAPLASDYNTLDGLNIHGSICDELHEWQKRELWDVIETATGARTQSLQLAITTAGSDRESICFEQREYVTKILSGSIQDDSYFGVIYTIDRKAEWPDIENDDWKDETVWEKANPNLGISIDVDRLQKLRDKANVMPAALNNFLRKHLNCWTQQVDRWIPMDLWDSNMTADFYKKAA